MASNPVTHSWAKFDPTDYLNEYYADIGPENLALLRFLAEAYLATDPGFDGRVTVPALWDKKTGRIVNNESSEIIRMLNSEFDAWGRADLDFYPEGCAHLL